MKVLTYNNYLSSTCESFPGELHFSKLSETEKLQEVENCIRGDIHLIWKTLILPLNTLLKKCPYCGKETIYNEKKKKN